MKIFYRQNDQNSVFDTIGIKECRFKQQDIKKKDAKNTTYKIHHHTEFEIHIILNGFQIYKTERDMYRVESGKLIIIPPNTKHQLIKSSGSLSKYAITFKIDKINITDCVCINAENQIYDNIDYILKESNKKLCFSPYLAENRAFETVISILRLCGFNESNTKDCKTDEDARLTIAKQYIKDNIMFNIKVSDVAQYCYISPKQLTRLFKECDGVTPFAFISKLKAEKIEKLLADNSLSLKEISEIMNFSSEYHFNLFFKKYSGMPPGEFRKMIK